ncbi:hypothetical protein [Sphingomonas montana]|uniref:hypothetical protein n=1 Tax=Sphingomonas montana TaxID=1843236 RepID=UPI00101ADCE2|nr:hypothetical protein [Sphingomonas montana]
MTDGKTDVRNTMRAHDASPVDLPDEPGRAMGEGRRGLGWTGATILIASLFLLLTNAQALNGWAAEQTPSETMVRVTGATEGWLAATERMQVATPRAWLHGLWKRAQAARFAGQAPAAED